MTTTKTEGKTTGNGPKQKAASPETLQAAYQIHTLAQMIRCQIAMTYPMWNTPMRPVAGFEPPTTCMSPMAPEAAPGWTVPTHWPW